MQTLRVNVGKQVHTLRVVRTFRDSRNHRPPIAQTQDGRLVYMSGLPVTDETHLEIVPDQYRYTVAQARTVLATVERQIEAIERGVVSSADGRLIELEAMRTRMEARIALADPAGTLRLETEPQIVTEPGVPEAEFHAEITPARAVSTDQRPGTDAEVVTRQEFDGLRSEIGVLTEAVKQLLGQSTTNMANFPCLPCQREFKSKAALLSHNRKRHA